MNMDPSYLQFISNLMNDDGFESGAHSRQPSLGSYPEPEGSLRGSRNNSMDECTFTLRYTCRIMPAMICLPCYAVDLCY
jgi:hypothetical protein